MLLSLIIENTTQNIFPPLQFFPFIEPILTENRDNIIFYDFHHPIISTFLLITEVTMANSKTLSKGTAGCNIPVQFLSVIYKDIKCLIIKAFLINFKSIRVKAGLHFIKTESAAQGIVNHRQTAVCGIHHSYNVQVFRNRERYFAIGKSGLRATVVLFYQH